MEIAVTTSDGEFVDLHFGKTEMFRVYRVGMGGPELVREVPAPAYCGAAGPGHNLMPEKLAAFVRSLDDCHILVTAMIGEAPLAELERQGLTVYDLRGSVTEVLREVYKLHR